MTNEEAVAEVCAIGRKLEADLARAEAEAELRRWRPMPNGGHDADFVRTLREGADLEWPVRPEVLPGNIAKYGGNAEGAKKT